MRKFSFACMCRMHLGSSEAQIFTRFCFVPRWGVYCDYRLFNIAGPVNIHDIDQVKNVMIKFTKKKPFQVEIELAIVKQPNSLT